MDRIHDYIKVSSYGDVKDYEALETGDGFIVSGRQTVTAAINTHCCAKFIALLEFLPEHPRGNHYHLRKLEHMTVLRGQLRCEFRLADDQNQRLEITLSAGQMVQIQPGCIHTFTAVGDAVAALEFAPEPFSQSDVIVVQPVES